ncbi:MAG: alkaline phosphatase family protein [Gemmataceae bacterium]
MPTAGVPVPDHVVIVMEENHSFNEILGAGSPATYIRSLANDPYGATFTQSFAIEHPSQPNYLDLFAGGNQGVVNDSLPPNLPFTTANLGAEMLSNGRTFTGYSEDLPAVGADVEISGAYARKHNPWVNWQGAGLNGIPAASNQPLTSFATDFANLPTLSFVIPNLDNDMHNGASPATIVRGDTWLQSHLDNYAQWAKTHNSLLIVTFDEDDSSQANHIGTLFFGPMVQHGSYSEQVDHYRVLRTLEDMYNLTHAGNSAARTPITDSWKASVPSVPTYYSTGAGAGGGPKVNVFYGDGILRSSFFAYDPKFAGGVRVATGDVNNDGAPDIITAPGAGGGPHIRIFSGADPTGHTLLGEFFAYGASFGGGVFVAAGDVNGDGFADIITGAGAGGGPHVRVFSGADPTGQTVLTEFYAYDAHFIGGVTVAGGDVNGDGKADIITGAGPGGGPHVKVISGKDGSLLQSFFAYGASFTGGVTVAAGDLVGDSKAEIITGTASRGGPHVRSFDGITLTVVREFFAFSASFTNGVTVGVSDINNNGKVDFLVGSGPGKPGDDSGSHLTVIDPQGNRFYDFRPYADFQGGVWVG